MNLNQVLQALRNADAAGDVEAARRLAQIASQMAGPAAPEPPSTERTWGEAAQDIGAALARGTGATLAFPGQLVGLIPGGRGLGEALAAPGEALSEYGESLKSAGLKAREALRSRALSEAEKDGFLAEFATAVGQTIKDPALLSTFLTEQLPQLLGPAAAVKVTTMLGRGAVRAAAEGTARDAAVDALKNRAAAAAVGTGAAMQGADIGADTYQAVYDLAIKQGMPEDEARAVAEQKARVAGLEAGAISVATSRIPGGSAIERRLAGLPGVPGAGRITTGLREAGTESIEEAGGAIARGVGMAEVDPTISPLTGAGAAAGFGALGGLGLGTLVGGAPVREPGAEPAAPGQTEIDVVKAKREAERQAAEAAKAAPANTAQSTIDETLGLPINEAYPKLTQAIEALKQERPTKYRDEAIKALEAERGRRQREDVEQRVANKRGADRFLPADEAAVAAVTPREEFDPTQARREEIARLRQQREDMLVNGKPPAPKSPSRRKFDELDARLVEIGGGRWTPPTAPTALVEEPTVRKVGAPAASTTGLQPTDIEALGITKKQPIYRRMLGKDMEDAGQRQAILEDIEKYLTKGLGSEESRAKLTEFKARFEPTPTPPVAAEPTPAPTVPEPTPPVAAEPETPSAVQPDEQPSGAGAPVAGGPAAVTPTEGAGAPEPSGVVPPVEDAGQPAGRETGEPVAVATLKTGEQIRISQVSAPNAFAPLVRTQYGEPRSLVATNDKGEETGRLTYMPGGGPIDVSVREADRRKGVGTALYDAFEKLGFKLPPLESGVAISDEARALRSSREAQVPAKLTAAERADLVEQIERISGRISQREYGTFYGQHTDGKGERVKNRPESIKAAQDLIARYGDESKYRTIPQTPLVQGVVSDAQLRKIVADIERALGGSVDITILDDVTDFDNKQAPGSRAGALQGGKIYLFRSGIADGVEGQKTIFHEVFHKGLANLLPPAEYRALMTKFYNQSAAVRQTADAYLASAAGKKDTEGMSPEEARVLAVEEALAEMAEATKLTGSTLRQLGNFFARLADRIGMPGLARAIRTMGLDPLQAFIRDAIQAGIKPSTATGQTRYRSLVGEKEERTLGQSLQAKLGGNLALGFRAQAMDQLAGVDYVFTRAYGNRIRDNRGDYNPVFLLSRALDAPRFATEVKKYGTMRRDPTGLLSVDTLTYNGQQISYNKVLEEIAAEAKVRGIKPETFLKDVGELLASHREYELMNSPQAAGLDFFLTPQEAATAEQAFQSDAFIKGVSEKLDQIRFTMIDAMVEAGRITPAKAQVWKDAIGYVPFSRIDDFDNLALPQGGGSNAKLTAFKEIAKYKGSQDRQTQNPVESFSKLMDWMVNESMKADAVGRALPEMELLGYADFVPNRAAVDNNKQGALVDAYVNGQKKVFYVPDPANLAAFIGTPKTDIPLMIRGAQKFSKYLRIGVTATPPFAIKQVFDDITRAYVHSGVKNPAAMLPRILLNFPLNWWNEIRGTESAAVRELARSGVVPAYDTVIGGNVKNILEETGLAPRSIGKAILRIMEAGAKASDVAVREAIYNQTLKETGDRALAELRAREIINFSRRGASRTADYLIRTIPFFNAYARSMDKLLLAAAGNPSAQRSIGATTGYARNLFYKRMGVLTVMGFGYAVMMSDDEEYQKQPDHVRDRNWIIPGGKELGFVPGIPIPPELSFFFKAIPERVVQYFKFQGTPEERDGIRVLKELMLNGVDLFWAPNLTPQIVKPVLENLMNYSFFLGRPLESQAQLALDPSERYGTGTSETMKAASRTLTDIATSTGIESLKTSPIMLENLVRGMFGMSAGIALSVADVMVNPTRTDRPLHQTIAAQLTGASAVMKDPVGMRYLDEIYNLDRSVEQVYNSYNRKLKDNPEDAEKYLKDNFGLYVVRSEVRSTMEAIRALNAQARAIDKMTDLSPEERRVIINDLRTQQNDLARDVYRLRRQVTEEQRMMDASR